MTTESVHIMQNCNSACHEVYIKGSVTMHKYYHSTNSLPNGCTKQLKIIWIWFMTICKKATPNAQTEDLFIKQQVIIVDFELHIQSINYSK